MSISAALNSAISGLGAASRSAQVVSSNISNALTEGYGRRTVDLATTISGGVGIAGVSRSLDPATLAQRRSADAEAGFAQTSYDMQAAITASLGEAGASSSLSGRAAKFDATLLEATSRPDSAARLDAVVASARDLTAALNSASEDIQAVRLDADISIGDQVAALSHGLARIDELNAEIQSAALRGEDTNALKDFRQKEIDALSSIVPVRILPRENDAVAIITQGGQILLSDSPAEIAFTPTGAMSASAVPGTPLSELTIDGRTVDMSRDKGRMSGGALQAAFDARDRTGTQAQAELDAVARDLIERMEGVDPSLGAGAAGLFTDDGAPLQPAPTAGLAGRITVNASVDSEQGGESWRLRSGIGSAGPGAPGDASLLQQWRAALNEVTTPSAPELAGTSRSFAGHTDDLTASFGSRRVHAESEASFSAAQLAELRRQELEQGVDTDDELQKLLLIEQIYGANTKVIRAADEMLQRLLEI